MPCSQRSRSLNAMGSTASGPIGSDRPQLFAPTRATRLTRLNYIASRAMDSTNPNPQMYERKFAPTYVERRVIELLTILLADVANDVKVAARDAGISDASFARLRPLRTAILDDKDRRYYEHELAA